MPIALVIAVDPGVPVLVHTVAPHWRVLTAPSRVTGLDIARRHREQVDLVVLDMDLPGMDSPDTCLLLRAMSATLPLLLFTSDTTHAALLSELGCQPARKKPLDRDALAAALWAALNAPPPDMRPGPAVGARAQRHAAARAHDDPTEHREQRLALFAACPVTRFGLAQHLYITTPIAIAEATSEEE